MWSLTVRIKREKQIVSGLQVVLPCDNHQLKGQRSLSPASLPISLVLAVKGCDELIWFSVLLTNVVVRTSCRVIRTSCCGSCSIWLQRARLSDYLNVLLGLIEMSLAENVTLWFELPWCFRAFTSKFIHLQ